MLHRRPERAGGTMPRLRG